MKKDEMQNVQHLMKSYKIKKVIFDRVEVNFPFNCYDICQEEDSLEFLYNLQNYLPIILTIYAVNVFKIIKDHQAVMTVFTRFWPISCLHDFLMLLQRNNCWLAELQDMNIV